ncbi:unnamed protein product [Acanthoscelides obtectus]|uniref:HTH CENPB-type domain-containing protein n=1 Tax=Acanthoscelides obtectus TaxID=200917 RepID=A0A9P0M7F2_ACAOB|nr:unnamed protein product [Acanthoscelides obtectus]CAK1680424.1 Tigger transposable element-derived protein 2 [Acanthoscelides obtectus]
MPRNYTKKNVRAMWSAEDLINAISDVRCGRGSIRQISRTYAVPVRTLMRRIQSGNANKVKLGRKSYLSPEHERSLVDYIKKMEKMGFALTPVDVKKIAYSFAICNNIENNFNPEKKEAGHDWFCSFMKRHPNLSIRKAQGMSTARAQGMNKEECDHYFDLLGNLLTENNLISAPRKIFNVDETGVQLNNNPGKRFQNGAEKGETVSVIACVNAEGHFLPPYCIMKGKNKKKEFEDGLPPGGTVVMSEKSAYVTTDIVKAWLLHHFIPRKEQGKALLVLDGHSSHCSDVEILDLATANDIILLCLPSHTTHWLQPLDRSFFKPLKVYWNEACKKWVQNNPGRKLSRLQFPSLLNTAWCKAASVQNAVSGFRTCGIFPFDKSKIPEYAFICKNTANAALRNENSPDENIGEATAHVIIDANNQNNGRSPKTADPDQNPFEAISAVPCIPGTSGCQKRKQHAEVLTSPEVVAAKREKKETKEKKRSAKLMKSQQRMKKTDEKHSSNTKEKAGSNKKLAKEKSRRRARFDSSSSESETEVVTQKSGESEIEVDRSEICAECGGYYFDKKGPKCDWIQCTRCSDWIHEICTRSDLYCKDCIPLQQLANDMKWKN